MKHNKETVKNLLARKMTRKEFIQFTGLAVIALLGFGNFASHFYRGSHLATHKDKNSRHGFGSTKFGV